MNIDDPQDHTTNTISISSSNAIIHMLFVLRPSRRYAHTTSPLH